MKNALVVVSHPDLGSFNHALADAMHRAFIAAGLASTFCDLHAEGFDPVITASELRGIPTTDANVRRHIELLLNTDVLGVVHANCWGAPPAMMKGWMDRVFVHGSAYAFEKGADDGSAPKGLLKVQKAIVLNTSNTSEEREIAAFGDPLERIWRDCLLRYCGVQDVERRVFRIVATSSLEIRMNWLQQAAELATKAALESMKKNHG
ncbi:MAG: NAD(P)H-dependent oxidoreductase [Beijerinckiaceae bacterium]